MASAAAAGAAPAAAAAPAAEAFIVPEAEQHKLHRAWTYWELRNADELKGKWTEKPTALYTFDTVEKAVLFLQKAPKIT